MTNQFFIKRIASSNAIKNPELRQRVKKSKVLNSEEFIEFAFDGSEAGFLSIEDYKYHNLSFIQIIFVLPEFRGLGLGTALLSKAENLAMKRGYQFLWLRPRSLDMDVEEKWLIEWYTRIGYKWSDNGDHLEKTL